MAAPLTQCGVLARRIDDELKIHPFMSKLAVNALLKYADAARRMRPLKEMRESLPASTNRSQDVQDVHVWKANANALRCLPDTDRAGQLHATRNRIAAAMNGCSLVLRDALYGEPCPCILIGQAHGL